MTEGVREQREEWTNTEGELESRRKAERKTVMITKTESRIINTLLKNLMRKHRRVREPEEEWTNKEEECIT